MSIFTLQVGIGDVIYGNIGIYKPESFSKHNYRINVKLVDDKFVVDWCISNWYEPEMIQGIDIVVLTDNIEKYEDL